MANPLGFERGDYEVRGQQECGGLGKKKPESFHWGFPGLLQRQPLLSQIVECMPCCGARKPPLPYAAMGRGTLQRRQVNFMPHSRHTIPIHPLAPAKVAVGAACNGCGVCCLFAPCPLGMVLSGRRSGACAALRWDDALAQYRCGAIVAPQEVLSQALPRSLQGLASALAPAMRRLGTRWIAAGTGCDSNLELEPPSPPPEHAPPEGVVEGASTTMPALHLLTLQSDRTVVRHPKT